MATNADAAADDGELTQEEILRQAKYGESDVESSEETDETPETEEQDETSEESEDDGQTDDQTEEESEETDETESDEEPSFVKQFPNIKGDTPEEYAKNLEEAYKNSTTEALRLKNLATEEKAEPVTEQDDGPVDPRTLYLDRIVNDDIVETYESFRKTYPQIDDPVELEKFQKEAADVSAYYIERKKVALRAKELFPRVAVNLGWEPQETTVTKDEKLKSALKDTASTSRTTSTSKKVPKSKVTDAEVSIAKQMGGWTIGKSDAEIRQELEKVK